MMTEWEGTLDNMDCDCDLCAEKGIDTTRWPARVIRNQDGEVCLEIQGAPEDDTDDTWMSVSRCRDIYPLLPPSLRRELVAAGDLDN